MGVEGVVVRLVGGGKVFFVRFMVNGWVWLVFGWGFFWRGERLDDCGCFVGIAML